MSKMSKLESKLEEQNKFIRNILLELGEAYESVKLLKIQSEVLKKDFQLLLKEVNNAA